MYQDNAFPGGSTSNQNQTKKTKKVRECDCTGPHEFELQQFLDRKPGWDRKTACKKWKQGKRICYHCDCIVNPVNHYLRCSGRTPTERNSPDEEYEIDGVRFVETYDPVPPPNEEPSAENDTQQGKVVNDTLSLTDETLKTVLEMVKEMNRTHEICTTLNARHNQLAQQQQEDQHTVTRQLINRFRTEEHPGVSFRAATQTGPRRQPQRRGRSFKPRRQHQGLVGASAMKRGLMSQMPHDIRYILVGIIIATAGRAIMGA
jgi:hypothetical protein